MTSETVLRIAGLEGRHLGNAACLPRRRERRTEKREEAPGPELARSVLAFDEPLQSPREPTAIPINPLDRAGEQRSMELSLSVPWG